MFGRDANRDIKIKLAAGLVLTSWCLSGCTFRPSHPVPTVELPATFLNKVGRRESVTPVQSQLGKPPSEWWREFNSEELDRLESDALGNNHDLKAAIARIAEAEAQAGIASGALLPTIQASGVAQRQGNTPTGSGGGVIPSNGTVEPFYQLGLTASYELDFWGKNRLTRESAIAAAQSSAYDRETVALTLVANVALQYFQYLAANERVEVARRNVENMTTVLNMVQQRSELGEGTAIEVEQQATALAQARAAMAPSVILREQALYQLATLVGTAPEALTLDGASLDTVSLPAVPQSIPSQLMASRPDIRKAEADLIGANANIGVARAELLPSFSLFGQRGVSSTVLSTLLAPASFYYTLAASMSATLFDHGKSLAQIDYSKAAYTEKIENYRQAILNALRDVEVALISVQSAAEEEKADLEAVEHARAAYALIQQAYLAGSIDYLEILDIERSQYQEEDAHVQAQLDRVNAATSLFRSLGGPVEMSPAN